VENIKKIEVKREPAEETDLSDTVLNSLVKLAEKKGVLAQEKYKTGSSKK